MENAAPRISRLLSLITLAGVVFSSATVSAGVNVWTTNGPAGQDIRALAINPANPATLYAGTYGGGIFKSTDSGGTWAASNTGLTNPYIYALAVNPVTPATVYSGTNGGVFKSTNSGGTWTAVNTGLGSLYVDALVIDPSTPTTLYAGTYGGVFKSTNSGAAWAAVNTGLGSPYIDALAIDPSNSATLYAGTVGPQVFKSSDAGGTWGPTGAGPNDPFGYGGVFDLAIDPANPAALYAATDYGLFKSIDGGSNWTAVNTGLTNIDVSAIAIDPSTPANVYAGTGGAGVFKSTNSGATWTAMNAGLTNLTVNALAIDPSTTARIYAGTGSGVFEYLDMVTPTGRSFYTVMPCRVFDTRDNGIGGRLLQSIQRVFTIRGDRCGIPATATAVSANLTIVNPSAQGHLLAYPADIGPPSTSTINFRAGQTRANNAMLTLDSQGRIAVTSTADTDLVFDVSGYFQ
jgi:photosystem II stability/assembly factor-like uncharacterized protein